MSDFIGLLLQAKVDPNAVQSIKKQIEDMSKNIQAIKVDVNIDKSAIKGIENINKQLDKIVNEKPIQIDVDTTKMQESVKKVETSIKGFSHISTKTWKDADGNVLMFKETLKDLANDIAVVDTYVKNADGTFDYLGRTINDKSVPPMIKLHEEALKVNEEFDKIAAKNRQATSDAAWKQYFQTISETSDELRQMGQYYAELEDNRSIDKIHAEALRMNKAFDKQAESAKQLRGTFAELKGEQKDASNVAKILSDIYGGLEVKNMSLNRANGQYIVTLKQSADETLRLRGTIDETTGALRINSEQIKSTSSAYANFWQQMKGALDRLPAVFGLTAVYYQSKRFINDTIKDIANLNKHMIELERVSNATKSELDRFYQSAPANAKKLGVLTDELIATTAEITKLGYSLSEAEYLTNLSLIGKTVGDLDNASDAVDYLTSILKGFRLETEQGMAVLDYLNHTANTTSINFASLGEGFKRMSAAMAEGNNTLQESTGLLVAGYDVVRNAEMVSTALRTTSLRLRGVGEDSEDLSHLVPKLEKSFNKFGISLKKDNDTFKSTFEILKDLSTVWGDLTDMERASILEDVAGKRGAQTVAAIIQNMQTAIDVADSFEASQGSAIIEHMRYMEGVEYAYNRMQGSLTELHNKLLQSSTLVKGLNLANTMIENVSALGKFSAAMTLATVFLGAFSIANKKAIKDMTDLQIVSNIGGLKKFGSDIILATGALLGFDVNLKNATISATALNAATAGLLLGIPLLIQSIGHLVNRQKRLAEEMKETVQAFEMQSQVAVGVDKLVESYEELASKSNRTAEEQEKLLKIKEQIKDLLPESTAFIDDENLSLAEQVEIIEDLNEAKLEELRLKAQDIINENSSRYEKDKKRLEELTKAHDEHMESLKELQVAQAGLIKGDKDVYINPRQMELLKVLPDMIRKEADEIEELTSRIQNYEQANKFLADGIEGLKEELGDTTDSVNEFDDALSQIPKTLEDYTEEFDDLTSKLQDYYVILEELESKEGMSAKAKQDIITKHQELLPYIEDEQELRRQLIRIIEEEEDAQRDAYKNMLIHSEDFFNAKIKGNDTLYKTLGEFYTDDLENAKSLADAKEIVEASLIKNLSGMWAKYYNAASSNMLIEADYRKKLAFGFGTAEEKEAMRAAINVIDQQKEVARRFDELARGLGGGVDFKGINLDKTKDSKSGSSKSKKDEYRAEADRYAKINLELDKNNILLQRNRIYQELADEDLKKRIKLMDTEIKLNKQRQQQYHALNQERRKEATELERSLAKQGFKFSGQGDNRMITNLNNIKGKTKEVEEQFKRYMQLQQTEIPQASQEWWNLQKTIENITIEKTIKEFEQLDERLKILKDTMSGLEYEFQLLDDKDLTGKADNIAKQMSIVEREVELAKQELEEMGEIGEDALQVVKDRQEELNKRVQEGTLSYKAMEKSLKDLRETARQEWVREQNRLLQDQRDQLTALEQIQEKIVQIIRKRGEEEKKALDEAHNAEMKSLEERHQERKKKYADDLDEFRKLIQDKINALDEQYEEEDYLEQLNKEREEANRLQREIDVLSLDDSLTARNKVIELRQKLADQNEKIAKMQQKKERDLLKKSLQDQLKDHEKDAKDKEKIADNMYDNEKKRLEEEYRINKEFLDRKYSDEQVYAEARESIMRNQVEVAEGVFMDIYDAFRDFEDKFGRGMGILGDIIKTDFLDQLEQAQRAVERLRDTGTLTRPRDDYDSDYRPRDDEWDYRDPPKHKYKEKRPSEFEDWSDSDYNEYIENKKAWERTNDEYEKNRLNLRNIMLRQQYWGTARMNEDNWHWKDLVNIRGYKHGGKITETGTIIAPFHGTKTTPEWIFNDAQLKNIIASTVRSSFKLPTLNKSKVTARPGSVYHIDKIFDISGTVTKDTLPLIRKEANSIEETLKSLNKGGTFRPVKTF